LYFPDVTTHCGVGGGLWGVQFTSRLAEQPFYQKHLQKE
jgi:hypothetical protein